jgi:hypothetical protein
VLSAEDLRRLTDWPEPLIEDYLNILYNVLLLAGVINQKQDTISVTSPIVLTGVTISFDFSTNNTWTGTNTFEDTVTVDHLQFDLTPSSATPAEGKMAWNVDDGTVNVGMPGGNVNLQLGQEQLVRVKNDSGGDMTNGQIVYISGASGNRPEVTLAKADTEATSAGTLGMLTEDIDDGQTGYITTFGLVRDVNTDPGTYSPGDLLWLSAATAGGYTKVLPASPNHGTVIGNVVRAHATEGIIFLRIANGLELFELHDVADGLSAPTDKALLAWNNTNTLWEQTPQLFYDFANNRLGIGIAAPLATFDLVGTARLGDSSTNYTAVSADGSISQTGTARRDWKKWTADNITLAVGTATGGHTVSNLQSSNDGSVYHIDETAGGAGGVDLIVEFVNVTAFNRVEILASYVGGAGSSHYVQILCYNFDTSSWDKCTAMDSHQNVLQLEDYGFVIFDDTDYIGTGGDAGDVRIRFLHSPSGNATHDVEIDVVALYQ